MAATSSPSTRWVVFKSGEPLVHTSEGKRRSLAYLTTAQLEAILGERTYFGQGRSTEEPLSPNDPVPKVLEGVRLRGPPIIFLGVKEEDGAKALPMQDFTSITDISGTPYFALDVSKISSTLWQSLVLDNSTDFCEPRSASSTFDSFDAPIFSLSRSMLDWNSRNKVSACFLLRE